ncbi:MAG: hypothetical protein PVF85_02505 [Anaerolineales bacterium]
MENTYTFIARSALNPLRVATFTLHANRMSIGMGSPIEQVESIIPDDEQEGEINNDLIKSQSPWFRPLILALMERKWAPFHIRDVEVNRSDGGLHVRAWSRVAGLRLFPVILAWEQVDNPAAADDFVREVIERQEAASPVRKFIGFFDYWASWVAGVIALLFMIGRQRGRRA